MYGQVPGRLFVLTSTKRFYRRGTRKNQIEQRTKNEHEKSGTFWAVSSVRGTFSAASSIGSTFWAISSVGGTVWAVSSVGGTFLAKAEKTNTWRCFFVDEVTVSVDEGTGKLGAYS